MDNFVVRQAIKSNDDTIIGYEILFQKDSSDLYNSSEDAKAANAISDFLLENNDRLESDMKVFMTFTPSLLFRNTPKLFRPEMLVIQLEDNILIHPLATVMIQKFLKAGYQFAIIDFQFSPRYFSMVEYIDYIKIDINGKDSQEEIDNLLDLARMTKGFHKKLIVTGVDSKESHDLAKQMEADFVQGTYIAENTVNKSSKAGYLEGNFFQLLIAITQEEPDLDEIEQIISYDASLTYSLLKMVNTRYFANRKQISSIQHAIVTLGITQLKQWVYLLSRWNDQDDTNEEVLKLSFMRANFASKLSKRIPKFGFSANDAYMLGMFSTLDRIVHAPMEQILEQLPIVEELKEAILHQTGPSGMLLQLIYNYEKADWRSIDNIAKELGIDKNAFNHTYFDCIDEVNMIWREIADNIEEENTEEK